MDIRELKGLELAARAKIVLDGLTWIVPSQSSNGAYRVNLLVGDGTCTCEDFQLRNQPCKHIHAARIVRERDGGAKASIVADAIPKKPTYKQNWPAYNLAQTTEKHRFQVLLADLCRGIPQPERKPGEKGRNRTLLSDAVFAATFKVYSTFSTRRFACDLRDAHERGHVTKPIHYNSISAYLDNPDVTPILHGLIARSAAPLRVVDVDFAVDSSGFSTSRFIRWFDHKYGVQRQGHGWVKVHIATGVKTNCVAAARILDKDAADSPQFKPLVEKTAETFTIRDVSADKAYLSQENLELVESLGGVPFVPFKSNSTAGKPGSLWEKLYGYYQFGREDFLKHYHQRSNVESTFSAVKMKFGDSVRSRSDTAMANEVLCKLVCQNICCVIASQCELGIEAVFWSDKPTVQADVLPMNRPG